MAELGTAYILIEPSMKGSQGKITKELTGAGEVAGDKAGSASGGSFGKAFSKGLKTVAKVGTAAFVAGGAATVSLVKNATEAYADYEQLMGGTELLFGSASDSIVAASQEAYKTVQMSQNDYLKTVNGYAVGLKTALGGNEQAAADLSQKIIQAQADVVAATGNSQEAVQNAFAGIMKSNYTMLDNLQLGITPTKEGMQEVIDKVNEWNTANGNATKYEIDNLADVQSALVDYIAMQGLSGYAAAESSGTIQGSLASTKASWDNLLVAMASGQGIGSAIDALVGSASQALQNIMPVATQALSGIASMITQLAPMLISQLPGLISTLLPGILSAVQSIMTSIVSLFPTLIPMIVDILDTGLPMIIQTGLQLVLSLAIGIAQALPTLIPTAIETILNLVMYLIENIDLLIDAAIQLMIGLADGLIQAIPILISKAPEIIMKLASAIISNAPKILQAGVQLIGKLKDGIVQTWNSVKSTLSEKFGQVKELLSKPFENAKKKVAEIIEKIKGLFSFKWEFPKLKMPHFSVGKGPTVLGIELPKINIDWYAKATDTPYLFNSPTVVGGAGGLRGFGERGSEIVYGRDNLLRDIASVSNRPINLYIDGDKLVGSTLGSTDQQLGRVSELKARYIGA